MSRTTLSRSSVSKVWKRVPAGFLSLALGWPCIAAHAQLTVPAIALEGVPPTSISAAEVAYHVAVADVALQATEAISFRRMTTYPKDSMLSVAKASGSRWLQRLQAQPVTGIQLDPAGIIGVAAGREDYAKAQIAARLATPGLSLGDRAFTLLTAVQAFGRWEYPARLPVAEGYLKALDALGDAASPWQFEARAALANAYYFLGRSADVIRHGVQAMSLVGRMEFRDRWSLFGVRKDLYVMTVEALTGLPDGRQQIDQLNARLKPLAVTPPELIALDSSFYWFGVQYQAAVQLFVTMSERLGAVGAPIVANYWINRPTRDSALIPVNDGRIHVVEVATYACVPCLLALNGLERLHQRFPQVDVMMTTWTVGSWGNRLVEPDDEAMRLTDFFLKTARATIPIGIWKGKKVLNEDGGMTPEDGNPNLERYPLASKPMIWILDGRGRIRRVLLGYSRDLDPQIMRTVEFLIRESASEHTSTVLSSATAQAIAP